MMQTSDMSVWYRQAMDIDQATAAEMEAKSAIRSCTTCSKAKAKCVKRPGEDKCERCSRLRKECHSREPVLRRRKVVKTTRAAQLEKLENKIEHLVNALSTTQAKRGFSIDHGQPSPPVSQASEKSVSSNRQAEVLNSLCADYEDNGACSDTPSSAATTTPNANPIALAPNSLEASPCTVLGDHRSLEVSMSEAEILLDRYRRLMSCGLPYVVVPSNQTAEKLHTEKPFLLHAIVTVTYFHDLSKQQTMVKHMMRDISERVLINSERSLDILQGLMVFISWYHPHLFWGMQISNLLHLAMAMCVDLGIDKSPQNCGDFKSAAMNRNAPPVPSRTPTLEEYRTLAGVFYLTSMLNSSFKKVDAMTYTPYLDEALGHLEQACEYESDLFLVQTVRLQHLIEVTTTTDAPSAPMPMYVKAFSVDLEKLRKNDPCKETNVFLRLQYLAAETLVWEMSLTDLQDNKAKPLRTHLDNLYNCVKAVNAFLEVYFSIPESAYLTVPFSVFAQFAHAFIVLIKLASLELDGWDMKSINDELRFSRNIDEAADRLEGSARSSPDGLIVNNDIFGKWAYRLRWMKTVYEAKFVQDEDKDGPQDRPEAAKPLGKLSAEYDEVTATPGLQQPTPPDDILSGDFFNYLDENFWQSFGGDIELGFPDMPMT